MIADSDTHRPLSGAQILARLNALGTSGMAVADNVFAIKGSADATKLARFEVDGLTTATTRTYTLPNADTTLAGLAVAQTFTAVNTFTARTLMGNGTHSADLSALVINRTIAIAPNDHAIRDESTVTIGAGAGGYASFDAAVTYAGANAYDHLHAFQGRQVYNGSGSLVDLVGLWDTPAHTGAGTVTNRRAVWIKNPTGAGVITNNYGVYVDSQTRGGTLNYAIFTAGTTPSAFGGAVAVTGALTAASVTSTANVRSTTGLFEGPSQGGFVTNAYFSAGWKYRTAAAATRFVHDSSSAVISVAVAGAADGAITWVDALNILPTSATFSSATPVTVSSTLRTVGRAGVSTSSISTIALLSVGEGAINDLTGAFQQGGRFDITGTSAATSHIFSFVCQTRTAAAAFTCALAGGAYLAFQQLGAGSTVTRAVGAVIERPTLGTNNAGISIIDGGGSPAWTGNFAIRSESTQPSQFAGSVYVPASATTGAPFRIPHGTAPTTPVDGDMWTTTAGLFVRINGVTVGPLT